MGLDLSSVQSVLDNAESLSGTVVELPAPHLDNKKKDGSVIA